MINASNGNAILPTKLNDDSEIDFNEDNGKILVYKNIIYLLKNIEILLFFGSSGYWWEWINT